MSIIASAVKHMLAAGMDPDAIVAAVADMEACAPPVETRSKGAIRTERWRDRKASQNVTERHDVTVETPVTKTVSPSFLPPNPQPITPIREDNNYAREKPEIPPPKGSRLPAAWTPSVTDQAFAAKEGLTPEETAREADKFRDYWCARSGRDATKRDWPGTWRNWIRTGVDRRRGAGSSRPPSSGNRPEARSMADIIVRRRSERAERGPIPAE